MTWFGVGVFTFLKTYGLGLLFIALHLADFWTDFNQGVYWLRNTDDGDNGFGLNVPLLLGCLTLIFVFVPWLMCTVIIYRRQRDYDEKTGAGNGLKQKTARALLTAFLGPDYCGIICTHNLAAGRFVEESLEHQMEVKYASSLFRFLEDLPQLLIQFTAILIQDEITISQSRAIFTSFLALCVSGVVYTWENLEPSRAETRRGLLKLDQPVLTQEHNVCCLTLTWALPVKAAICVLCLAVFMVAMVMRLVVSAVILYQPSGILAYANYLPAALAVHALFIVWTCLLKQEGEEVGCGATLRRYREVIMWCIVAITSSASLWLISDVTSNKRGRRVTRWAMSVIVVLTAFAACMTLVGLYNAQDLYGVREEDMHNEADKLHRNAVFRLEDEKWKRLEEKLGPPSIHDRQMIENVKEREEDEKEYKFKKLDFGLIAEMLVEEGMYRELVMPIYVSLGSKSYIALSLVFSLLDAVLCFVMLRYLSCLTKENVEEITASYREAWEESRKADQLGEYDESERADLVYRIVGASGEGKTDGNGNEEGKY